MSLYSKKIYTLKIINNNINLGDSMMNEKILGVLFIIAAIIIFIWPYIVPIDVTNTLKWIIIIVLVIAGVFLLLRKNIK